MIKNLPANTGDTRDVDSIPGSGRSPGEGKSNPLQYSWLENSMDRGAGRLQSMKTERVRHTQKECTHTQTPSVLDGNLFK